MKGRRQRTSLSHALVCAAALVGPGIACAQVPPDAGSLLQQIEKQQRPALPPKSEPQFEPPPPLQSLGGATVSVTAFRFVGNTLLSDAQLAPIVARFLNRPLDFAQLQNAAIAVATAYRKAGWVVRAYLPEQDITGGTVSLQVVEARFGAVHVEGNPQHVSAGQLRRIAEAAQAPGAPLSADALDRALLLMGDLPGVTATGRLAQGQSQAQTDLVVAAADGPPISGNVIADNAGPRAMGAGRVIADVSLNSPVGIGDRLDAVLLGSQGSNYARLDYSVPVGSDGWRAGVNASHLGYEVITAPFEALDAHGTSTTAGLEASYPILRSRLENLYFSFDADDKRFDNDSGGAIATQYTIESISTGVYGNLFDSFGGGGASNASITVEQGEDDLGGSPNEGADALTTRTAGGFRKLRITASRLQFLTDHVSLYAGLTGQAASKNLDSSEKIYLGGADGVRAYPENEGGGSQGLLLDLESRERLPANFNTAQFLDWGSVQINKDNDFSGAAAPNTVTLKGAGVSVGWLAKFGLGIKATWAHRIGSNPEPTSTGEDQDGSHILNRVWLQASMPF
ncbi:MAG: ShlB/FhaC/HecB family hemolysin secretion/activation protein [Steroidobacteraceae bacterium]|jgi:hemolysin activation/secretion protein